jgi:hypothetical protein
MSEEIWKAGDKCRVRAPMAAGARWVDCEITLASENQRSLALKAEKPLLPGEGFAINLEEGCIQFLLYQDGDKWLEFSSGHPVEIERARE